MSESNESFQVGHLQTKITGGIGFSFFAFMTVVAWGTSIFFGVVIFAAFAVYGLWMFLVYGTTTMDRTAIYHHSKLGNYKIGWKEIRFIETDSYGNTLVFKGEDKQLVIPMNLFWSGKGKNSMWEFLWDQTKELNLEISYNAKSAFAISRNTKIT